jgi:hypothetical protein
MKYSRAFRQGYSKRKIGLFNQSVPEHIDPGLAQFAPKERPVDLPYPQDLYLTHSPQQYRPNPTAPMQAAMNEIDQAMDQMIQMPQHEQEDPYLLMQMMFNQQMQYMADPFMMPMMGPM